MFFIKKYQTAAVIEQQIKEGYEYYLLNLEGKTAGYLGIQPQNGFLKLSKLYILKEFRGNKIGEAALRFTEKRASEHGLSAIDLDVNRQNYRFIHFYEKNGYSIVEDLVFTFENGYTVEDYMMRKVLNM